MTSCGDGEKSWVFWMEFWANWAVRTRLANSPVSLASVKNKFRRQWPRLARHMPSRADTVASAAAATGLSADTLQGLLGQIGGEGALDKISGMIDRDGDGNPVNDIMGMAGKLFGR